MSPLAWRHSTTMPDDWATWVAACRGGIFHFPASLLVGAEGGQAGFWWADGGGSTPDAVALAREKPCAFSRRLRHVTFETFPAVRDDALATRALHTLRDAVSASGAAEVVMRSYDAPHVPADGIEPRLEFVVPLEFNGDEPAHLSATHRRHWRRANREDLSIRFLVGAAARDAIDAVQISTVERAESLARGFERNASSAWSDALVPGVPSATSGLATIAAFHGDTLLSAALIGRGAARAFYHIGGSTPEGFERSASVWLHGRIMRILQEDGVASYNLGGTPVTASRPEDSSHGLYRFKAGFGAMPAERRGLRWVLDRPHAALHRAFGILRRSS